MPLLGGLDGTIRVVEQSTGCLLYAAGGTQGAPPEHNAGGKVDDWNRSCCFGSRLVLYEAPWYVGNMFYVYMVMKKTCPVCTCLGY